MKIEFNKTGYDPSIDFIKGLCIIFVILTHCMYREELSISLFPFWGDTAVPIFLLIQVFHHYKIDSVTRLPSIRKLWKRILMPYVMMIAFSLFINFIFYYNITKGRFDINLYWDKRGPGSYYIFIYLQFAFILPLLTPLFKRVSLRNLLILFLVLSQVIEFISSWSQCPDNLYRITFFRYTFLFFLGYILATKGLHINTLTTIYSLIGIVFIYLFSYTNINLEPWFSTHLDLWPLCHWICYGYVAYFFLCFLKTIYSLSNQTNRVIKSLVLIGKSSYEIYLFQIFYYSIPSIYISQLITHINNYPIERFLYIFISLLICVLPPIIKYKKQKKCS